MTPYRFTPRDPTVLGDGRPLERQSAQVWPIPATLTAAVNRWAYDASGHRDRRRLDLISTTLRGPLLHDGARLYVPPPADARLASRAECAPWIGGAFLDGAGVLWPDGFPALPRLYHLQERDLDTGDKRPEIEGAVRLDSAIRWAMGQRSPNQGGERLWRDEDRMHVSIDAGPGTARDGALFRSAGVRLNEDLGWAFTWSGPTLLGGQDSLVTFGGEGRQGWLEELDAPIFPDFAAYDRLFSEISEHGAWLRVQLLTPGLFEGDVPVAPRWLLDRSAERCGQPLSLVAMTLGRYRAFSGWRQHVNTPGSGASEPSNNKPRAVRRCVPAGAVYWLGDAQGAPLRRDVLMRAAEQLWFQSLDLSTAPASRQGFGLALPGFTPFHDEVAP